MTRSMTGYTLQTTQIQGTPWTIELKSVNHRFLDISVRTPSFLSPYEAELRKVLAKDLTRGKIYFSINTEQNNGQKTSLNNEAVASVFKSLKKTQKDLKIPGEIQIGDLVKIPNLFIGDAKKPFSKSDWVKLKKDLATAIRKFITIKEKEGKVLRSDVVMRLGRISSELQKIQAKKGKVLESQKDRLKTRINQMIDEVQVDEDRLMREVAISLEKMDITEEIVRLKAHLKLFKTTLQSNKTCGKDLDFIVQEMNRETNTIGSKVQNKDISHLAIAIKSEIEKIREQIQNIE